MSPKLYRCSYVALAGLLMLSAFFWTAIYRPHKAFRVGMSLADVERVVGTQVELIPLGQNLNPNDLENEKRKLPVYMVRIRPMFTTLYLNSYKEIVRIEYLLGPPRP